MLPNMTGFKITEVLGHMATVGHTWALGNTEFITVIITYKVWKLQIHIKVPFKKIIYSHF